MAGNTLRRDGAVWVSHGVVSIAFVAPPAAQSGVFLSAYQHYSTDELAAMQAWGADTVRFQVSQPGLDPQNSLYTADFVTTVQNAVLSARALGLNVIVSVQDETQSGETQPAVLPNAATQRVWQVLAPLFNGDQGILYEMLNEPELAPNPANWAAWASAMNAVIATIRQTGSKNVVVADGLDYAEHLDGAPALTDPENEVAYAAHPYFHNAADQTRQAWATKFGNFAQTAPVLITEWTTVPNYYADANTAQAALNFLSYLAIHGTGLSAYAYGFSGDAFGSVVHGFSGVPSTFANGLEPGDADYGPGTLVQEWYLTGTVPTTLTPRAPFFTGASALSNGVYYLAFPNGNSFGYYSYLSEPSYLYHFDLGYEYVIDAADGNSGVYFYDFASQDFFYTSPTFPFPYLYDFDLNTVLYYYPDPNNPGHYNTDGTRYFYDFNTGTIISK